MNLLHFVWTITIASFCIDNFVKWLFSWVCQNGERTCLTRFRLKQTKFCMIFVTLLNKTNRFHGAVCHRRRQNVMKTSVTHSVIASCITFLIWPCFAIICDLLLNRRTAAWNLFVNFFSWNCLNYWYQRQRFSPGQLSVMFFLFTNVPRHKWILYCLCNNLDRWLDIHILHRQTLCGGGSVVWERTNQRSYACFSNEWSLVPLHWMNSFLS